MKKTLSAIMAGVLAPLSAWAINLPMGPFTFVGRVTDAEYVALGESNPATIRAQKDGVTIAECTTFYRAQSACNYCLPVQMTDREVAGYAQVNDDLVLSVTDQYGKTWVGLVSADDSRVGASGTFKHLNIVLADNIMCDGVPVDRDLYDYLKALWEVSEYWREGETFDVTRDYDGDGVSTLNEAYAGTDPFDKLDTLKIRKFELSPEKTHKLVFTTKPGRAYVIESTDDLKGSWQEAAFKASSDAPTAKVLSVAGDDYDEEKTVYLLPLESSGRFYRIRLY